MSTEITGYMAWHPKRTGSLQKRVWSEKSDAFVDAMISSGINQTQRLPDGRFPETQEELKECGWRIRPVKIVFLDKEEGEMNAYITGSRAYGTPREDSDIDLVIAAPQKDCELLWGQKDLSSASVRYGRLNLVVFASDTDIGKANYAKWKAVHDALVAESPVTREYAIQKFQSVGLEQFYHGLPTKEEAQINLVSSIIANTVSY